MLFLSLCFVSGIGIISAYDRSTEREENDWNRTIETEVDRVVSAVEPLLQSAYNAGYSIFNAKWYGHYRNVAGIYADEFDDMRRYEIVNELASQLHALPLVHNILVITPSQNTVISSEGWLSMDLWMRAYPILKIESTPGHRTPPGITVIDKDYCVIVLNDTMVRREKSVVCILFSRKTAEQTLRRMLGEQCTSATLLVAGQPLLQHGKADEGNIVVERNVKAVDFSIQMTFKSYVQGIKRNTDMTFILLMMAAVSLSMLLSILITLLLIRPINKMIVHLGGQTDDLKEPYRFIYAYLDSLSKKQTSLSQENDSLREARRHMLYLMRNEIIMSMLSNPDFNFSGEYVRTGFPWMLEDRPFIMAACTYKQVEGTGAFPLAKEVPVTCDNCCCTFTKDQAWYLYWFKDQPTLQHGLAQIKDALEPYIVVISPELHHNSEIHPAYLSMSASLSKAKREWLTLPTTEQGRLLNLLYAGKQKESAQAVSMVCHEFNPDAVLGLLIQVATDCGFDASDHMLRCRMMQDEADQASISPLLEEFAVALCRFMTADKTTVPVDIAAEICNFLDTHYADPDMSVNYLADCFSVNRTMISRSVKFHTGETFSERLTRLRMEEAVRLIQHNAFSLQQISEMVGIQSYLTFMRTFNKVYGCSPSKWKEQNDV